MKAISLACLLIYVLSQGVAWGAENAVASPPLTICLVSGSKEYQSDQSLSNFQKELEGKFNLKCVRAFGQDKGNGIPELDQLRNSDVMVLFTRRIVLNEAEIALVKAHLAAGKAIVGIRTASHAFQNFLELDKEVWGGNYQGHYGDEVANIQVVAGFGSHPILTGFKPFSTTKLYKNPALAEDVTVLLTASHEKSNEPVAWTCQRRGRAFYTSLGTPEDFQRQEFRQLLVNAIFWTAKRSSGK